MSKNIALNQEFYLATPKTKQQVIEIYNFSWFGCVLWNLFCPAATGLESSYNISGKVMFDLPFATHRGVLEPLTERIHLIRYLSKDFWNFKRGTKDKQQELYCNNLEDKITIKQIK